MRIRGQRFLIEVPLYRQSEESFWREFFEHRDKHLATLRLSPGSDSAIRFEDRLLRLYPGPWRYNAMIGGIRVYMLWDQIRADRWSIDGIGEGRRYDRRAKKRFDSENEVFQTLISAKMSNGEVAAEIRHQLVERGPLRYPKGTHVDLEVFDDIAPFVDWQAIRATVEREWFSVPDPGVEVGC